MSNDEDFVTIAETIVDAWEEAENESMREGHRETLVRLIVEWMGEEKEKEER